MSKYKELADRMAAGSYTVRHCREIEAILRSLDAQKPAAWWYPKGEQFALANKDGSRPFAKVWEPLYAAPVAAQPTELEELRKLVKDFPLNDQDVPIIYDTNEIDLITYALTGDDGEDSSVTVLQRLVRALSGKTVYNLLEDAEAAAQPQQAKPEPLSDAEILGCAHDKTTGLSPWGIGSIKTDYLNAVRRTITAFCQKNGIKERG